jgi:hypothetical protein
MSRPQQQTPIVVIATDPPDRYVVIDGWLSLARWRHDISGTAERRPSLRTPAIHTTARWNVLVTDDPRLLQLHFRSHHSRPHGRIETGWR